MRPVIEVDPRTVSPWTVSVEGPKTTRLYVEILETRRESLWKISEVIGEYVGCSGYIGANRGDVET